MTKKTPQQNYKFLLILALHQEFIDKKICNECVKVAQQADNALQAIIDFLKGKHLSTQQIRQLLDLYKIFMTRQENLQFGAIATAFNFVRDDTIATAIEKQQDFTKNGEKPKLGQLLVASGAITEKQRDLVLLKQQRDFAGKIKEIATKEESEDQPAPEKEGRYRAASPKLRELDRIRGVVLKIDSDAMAAFLEKINSKEGIPDFATTMDFLSTNGIIYGMVDRNDIKAFLTSDFPFGQQFRVARGVSMKLPKDGVIRYLFKEQFLTAGKVYDDGSVDFRDRGGVPMVKPGSVLARKIPVVKGKSGTTVFGDVVEPPQGFDPDLVHTEGAVLSENGLEILSAVKGFPRKDMTGRVSVVQEYCINGDVDFHTGHVEFDGNVAIDGIIKSGFRVSGHLVKAEAVDGGTVVCEGDLVIAKGIRKAQIHCRGNVYAAYIHHSNINCMGDVVISREVLDSKMILFGACRMPGARILTSDVMARDGIMVGDVGTPTAKPSVIRAGVTGYADNEIKRVDRLIKERQQLLDARYAEKDKLDAELKEMYEVMNQLETAQENSISMITELEDKDRQDFSPIKVKMLENHKKHLASLGEKIKEQQSILDRVEAKHASISQLTTYYSEAVKTYVKEMLVLREMRDSGRASPKIEIQGIVYTGTVLCGPRSSTVVRQAMKRIRIKEIQYQPDEDSPPDFKLIIENF